jgi:hypothetical protein
MVGLLQQGYFVSEVHYISGKLVAHRLADFNDHSFDSLIEVAI